MTHHPEHGGRYSRDPKTGELTRLPEDETPPEPVNDEPAPAAATDRKGGK